MHTFKNNFEIPGAISIKLGTHKTYNPGTYTTEVIIKNILFSYLSFSESLRRIMTLTITFKGNLSISGGEYENGVACKKTRLIPV